MKTGKRNHWIAYDLLVVSISFLRNMNILFRELDILFRGLDMTGLLRRIGAAAIFSSHTRSLSDFISEKFNFSARIHQMCVFLWKVLRFEEISRGRSSGNV